MHSLDAIYRERSGRLIGLAKRHGALVNAADVVHDAFLMTLDRVRRGKVDGEQPLYPYLCSLVRHRARERRYSEHIFESFDVPVKGPSMTTKLAAKRVWKSLTPQERIAIAHLHFLEEDISRADRGVFATRIRVARKRLGEAHV